MRDFTITFAATGNCAFIHPHPQSFGLATGSWPSRGRILTIYSLAR